LQITYALTENEYVAGYRLFRAAGLPSSYRAYRISMVVLGILLVAGWFVHVVAGPWPRNLYAKVSTELFWGIVALLGSTFILKYSLLQDVAASNNYDADPTVRQEVKAEFSSLTTGFETGTSRSESMWAAYLWYAESDSVFILAVSRTQSHIVPKSAFASPDLEAFRELLQEKLPKRG
jgi:hypothetical protein